MLYVNDRQINSRLILLPTASKKKSIQKKIIIQINMLIFHAV